MKKEVIAIFDIGKTNKKFLLFDKDFNLVEQEEKTMQTTVDEDGFECDDIELMEKWIGAKLKDEINTGKYHLKAVNFSTYGASLAFLDEKGNRLTPIYDYLKPIPEKVAEEWYSKYGGKTEFCRRTASPALDRMLNSGVQIMWLKKFKKEVFQQIKHILHLPQYLSFIFTNHVISEYTSIGCHTGMWDFDNMQYHPWLKAEGISMPYPMSNSYTLKTNISDEPVLIGTGIHDSSASLAPYLLGQDEQFILVSTGTWCINMNPFNHTPLSSYELEKDCLCYLSVEEKPVKSSRFFMGHIHDLNVSTLFEFFHVPKEEYKKVKADEKLLRGWFDGADQKLMFFKDGVPENYIDTEIDLRQFENFNEAYQRLVFDLTRINAESIRLVQEENDGVQNIFISGGFSRNEIFVKLMTLFFPDKKIYTSKVDNASALGAALVVQDAFETGTPKKIDLNLKEWEPFK